MRELTLDLDCELSEAELNERGQTMSSAMLNMTASRRPRRRRRRSLPSN
jgi:hypothetical protein